MGGKFLRSMTFLLCDKASFLGVLPVVRPDAKIEQLDAAHAFHTLLPPFGACMSTGNPAVQANEGRPVPCTPFSMGWKDPSTVVKLGGVPAIHSGCTMRCAFGGKIKVLSWGLSHVNIKT